MNGKWTSAEVREKSYGHKLREDNRTAAMLDTLAERIETDEKAVPVGKVFRGPNGYYIEWAAGADILDYAGASLFTHPHSPDAADSGRVTSAVANDDAGIEWVLKHRLFLYEVDFGDEGKGRYVRLSDFNKVVAKLEAALAAQQEQITDGKAQWDEVAGILGANGDDVDDVLAKARALAAQGQGEAVAYFSADPAEGDFRSHKTLAEAIAGAESLLEFAQDAASDDGWVDEPPQICYGIVLGGCVEKEGSRRPAPEGSDFSEMVDFRLTEPNVIPAPPASPAGVPDGWMLIPEDIHPDDEIVDCSGIRNALNQRPGFRAGFSDELSLIATWWEQITSKSPEPFAAAPSATPEGGEVK